MSLQLFRADVLFYQRFLKANGFFIKKLDGVWGANTDAADAAFRKSSTDVQTRIGTFDPRSEENISTLAPKVQELARTFLAATKILGVDVRIISGTRTYAEQDALYKIGRTVEKDRGPVTNAKGGQSNHNFGLAWDIGIFNKGKYVGTDPAYIKLAKALKDKLPNTLEWGGNWITFKDTPHYQHIAITPKIADVRALFEVGSKYV